MKSLIILFIIFSFYGLKAQTSNSFVRFSGSVINNTAKELTIFNYKNYKKVFLLSENGNFSDTLKIERGYYTLRCGNEISKIFLAPGYDIKMFLDVNEFDESIQYNGIGSPINNYLAKVYLYNEKNSLDFIKEKELSTEGHYNYIINFYNGIDKLLDSNKIEDQEFVIDQKNNYDFEILYRLLDRNKKELFNQNFNSNVSSYVAKQFKKISLTDSILFKKNGIYKYLVLSYFNYGLTAKNPIVLKNFNDIKNSLIKKEVLKNIGRGISVKKQDFELYYNTLKSICSDTTLLNKYAKKYNQILKLKPGLASPSFTCKDINGKFVSLSDFKGKLVYIDLWATWCGPCKTQIPFLNELEEKYKEKNISFVSISIDKLKNIEKWKNMIKSKEMGGIQLIAENAWESEFAVALNVESIPRFVLLDQKGNIINIDAPRPSTSGVDIKTGEQTEGELNKELIQLIEKHLK